MYNILHVIYFSVGNVLNSVDNPAKVTSCIQARIIIFNIKIPITNGYSVSFCLRALRNGSHSLGRFGHITKIHVFFTAFFYTDIFMSLRSVGQYIHICAH